MRRLSRLFATATLVAVLASGFAVPSYCANYVNPYVNNGYQLNIDMGTDIPKVFRVGGEIKSMQAVYYCDHYSNCDNMFYRGCNQYLATGTSSGGVAMPYSKVSTAGPTVRLTLANAAKSLGFVPGEAFEIEIGQYTGNFGYVPCSQLYMPMNYEMYFYPPAGYTPYMLALLPNGTITALNDAQFERGPLGMFFTDGSRMTYIHTTYPKAVYMLVYK